MSKFCSQSKLCNIKFTKSWGKRQGMFMRMVGEYWPRCEISIFCNLRDIIKCGGFVEWQCQGYHYTSMFSFNTEKL